MLKMISASCLAATLTVLFCLVALLTLLTIVAAQQTQTVYYVGPAGSDSNPGTQDRPFATIQKAVNLKPGVINVLDGYFGPTPSGACVLITQATPLVIQAVNPGRVFVDAQYKCGYYFEVYTTAQTITITGLDIKGGVTGGVNVKGSHTKITYDVLHDIGNVDDQSTSGGHVGILTNPWTDDTVIDHCKFFNIGRTNRTCGGAPCTPRDQNLYLEGTHVTVTNSTFRDMVDGWAMALKHGGFYKIIGNMITGPIGQGREGQIVIGSGLAADSVHDVDIENNLFINPTGPSAIVGCVPVFSGVNTFKNNFAIGAGLKAVWDSKLCGTAGTSGLDTLKETGDSFVDTTQFFAKIQ